MAVYRLYLWKILRNSEYVVILSEIFFGFVKEYKSIGFKLFRVLLECPCNTCQNKLAYLLICT